MVLRRLAVAPDIDVLAHLVDLNVFLAHPKRGIVVLILRGRSIRLLVLHDTQRRRHLARFHRLVQMREVVVRVRPTPLLPHGRQLHLHTHQLVQLLPLDLRRPHLGLVATRCLVRYILHQLICHRRVDLTLHLQLGNSCRLPAELVDQQVNQSVPLGVSFTALLLRAKQQRGELVWHV